MSYLSYSYMLMCSSVSVLHLLLEVVLLLSLCSV